MRGSAGRIMIRPGQAIMIAWLTTAHAPLWEPAHERAPPKKKPPIRQRSLVDQCPVKIPGQVRTVAERLVAGASAAAHCELRRVGNLPSVGCGEADWSRDQVRTI